MRRRSIQQAQELAKSKGGVLLSDAYLNIHSPMDWECVNGHRWTTSYNAVSQGSWCPECYADKKKLSLSSAMEVAKDRGGECLSDEYVGVEDKLRWRCSCKYEWEASLHSVKNNRSWCPRCMSENRSLGVGAREEEVRKIFEEITGKKFARCKPAFMQNPETGYFLELDGFCEELGLAFEYDGEQHFKPVNRWGGEDSFKKTQVRDGIKDELVRKQGIKLIRVPYWIEKLEEYIKEKMDASK